VEPAHRHRSHRSCTEAERDIERIPVSRTRLRERFPEIALLQPVAQRRTVSMAHAWSSPRSAAGAGRLPGHLQPHAQTIETGTYQVVVEYSEEKSAAWRSNWRDRTVPAAVDDTPFDLADRPAPSCANSTRTSASARAPDRSSMPPWRATFPTAA
jgi:cyanophycin synthetase